MSVRAFLSRFRADERGAAAEFVLVLPLALLFLIGTIDAGRYFYEVNKGEKATQFGARFAVVTDVLPKGLKDYSYVGEPVGSETLSQGDPIPAAALGMIYCEQSGCECREEPCPDPLGDFRSAAFGRLVARMQAIKGDIDADNVIVEYRGSGLGYAGDPNGMDIAPLTTVRLTGMTFPIAFLFGREVNLPDFSYTLTMEDGEDKESN